MYPIRCFTCCKVLGNLWEVWFILTEGKCIVEAYSKYTKKGKQVEVVVNQKDRINEIYEKFGISSPISKPLACDMLGINRKCCRTTMFTTVEYE